MDENFARNDELLGKKMVAIYLSLPNPLSPFPPLPPLPFDTCDGGQWYA